MLTSGVHKRPFYYENILDPKHKSEASAPGAEWPPNEPLLTTLELAASASVALSAAAKEEKVKEEEEQKHRAAAASSSSSK